MITIYTAPVDEMKTLYISNVELTYSRVYINGSIFDNVELADGTEEAPNHRVLPLELKAGDVVQADDNSLVTYSVK